MSAGPVVAACAASTASTSVASSTLASGRSWEVPAVSSAVRSRLAYASDRTDCPCGPAASFCLAASSTAVPFVVLRFLQAVGASAALVATFATVRDVYADRQESVVIYSLFSSMLAFVPALGPIAGARLAGRFGWRSIFVTLGVLAGLAVLHALLRWMKPGR